MNKENPKEKIAALLDRLERKAEKEFAPRTLIGRAINKSEEKLYLATERGVLGIPISEIDDVHVISSEQPDRVAVDVRRVDAIEARIGVQMYLPGFGGFGEVGGVVKTGATYTGGYCVDTCTITGGPECDATDDSLGCSPGQIDDYWV